MKKMISWKHFIYGILYVGLFFLSVWLLRLPTSDAFSWLKLIKDGLISLFILGAALYNLDCAFSKEALLNDKIDSTDERNQLISDLVDKKIGQLAFNSSLIFSLVFVSTGIYFNHTPTLLLGILFTILLNLYFWTSLFYSLYYERRI